MDRTSVFETLPENDNSAYRKPDSIRNMQKSKSAFSDLSNRVQKGTFQPGTPKKIVLSEIPLTFPVQQENYDCLEFKYKDISDAEVSSDIIAPIEVITEDIEVGRGSTANISLTSQIDTRTEAFSDGEDDLDFPEPEAFHHSQYHDLEYYSSLPSPPGRYNKIPHNLKSYDFEEEYDVAEELHRLYPYKDKPEFDLQLSYADEKDMYMFDSEDDEIDMNMLVSESVYPC